MEEPTYPLSLLLVQSESDDRATHADYLRGEGFDVQEAATTDSALPLVAHATAVITDLPVSGSIDAVEFIDRVRGEFPDLPIVVTAVGDGLDRARAAGADAVLLKPCSSDALLDAVLEALESRDGRSGITPARRRLSERRTALRGGGRRDSDLS